MSLTICPHCLQIPDLCTCKGLRHDEVLKKPAQLMLDEAKSVVYGQRQKDYGPAKKNFQDIADVWSVILGQEVTTEQVVLCMIGLKMARLCKSPDHRDSWVDIAGYVACIDKMERGE